jgi:hypothetical protein
MVGEDDDVKIRAFLSVLILARSALKEVSGEVVWSDASRAHRARAFFSIR